VTAKSIEDRVTLLENEMQALRDLPARVTSLEGQLLQFRAEVRDEFSATRDELRREIREVDRKIDTRIDELGAEMRLLFEDAIDRIKNIQDG
jgi:C4-type Zn-finger protein